MRTRTLGSVGLEVSAMEENIAVPGRRVSVTGYPLSGRGTETPLILP
jgi:hypothetical protein